MVLKLVMAYSDEMMWQISAASVAKWHKCEGECVNYGEDVLDLRVEEFALPVSVLENSKKVIELNAFPRAMAQLPAKPLDKGEELYAAPAKPQDGIIRGTTAFFVRVTSSDTGILRRVCVAEGERCEVGSIIGLLSTDARETLGDDSTSWQDASVFRVVANLLHENPCSNPPATDGSVIKPSVPGNQWVNPDSIIFWSQPPNESCIGIYLKGRQYLNAIFASVPRIREVLRGTCCIARENLVNLRSDILLQCTGNSTDSSVASFPTKLGLPLDYFNTHILDRTFEVPGPHGLQHFPMTLVLLSVVPDVLSVCYRHREHGFILEPSPDMVTNSVARALSQQDTAELHLFNENFAHIGKIPVDQFTDNFGRVITRLKASNKHVIVFNTVTIAANDRCHSYQFLKESPSRRRLEFNLALAELSRKFDFPIVDVDRILKRNGVRDNITWDQFDPSLNIQIAEEAFNAMQELEIFNEAVRIESGQ